MLSSSRETEHLTQCQNLSAPLISLLQCVRACTCTERPGSGDSDYSLSDCVETLEACIIDVAVNKGLWWPRGTAGWRMREFLGQQKMERDTFIKAGKTGSFLSFFFLTSVSNEYINQVLTCKLETCCWSYILATTPKCVFMQKIWFAKFRKALLLIFVYSFAWLLYLIFCLTTLFFFSVCVSYMHTHFSIFLSPSIFNSLRYHFYSSYLRHPGKLNFVFNIVEFPACSGRPAERRGLCTGGLFDLISSRLVLPGNVKSSSKPALPKVMTTWKPGSWKWIV